MIRARVLFATLCLLAVSVSQGQTTKPTTNPSNS